MIAAAVSFSCQKEIDAPEENLGTNDEVVDFVPGPGRILAISPTGADTKIGYGDAVDVGTGENDADGNPITVKHYPVVWTNGDVVKLLSENNTAGVDYTYTTESTEGVASAVFTGDPVDGESRYAVYPSTRARGLSDGKLKVSFGALRKQEFHTSLDNNKGNLKYIPMWAKEGEGDDTGKFQFNNLCGAVSFKFNDYQELRDMQIVSVEISSKSKYISGCASFDPTAEDLELVLEAETTGKEASEKTVIATKNEENTFVISTQAANPSIDEEGVAGYIVALPVGTYEENDLTVTITDNLGRVFKREITKELVITPGQVRTFPVLPFTFAYGEANSVIVAPGTSVNFDASLRYSFDKTLSVDNMKVAEYLDATACFEEGVTVETVWEISESGNSKDMFGTVVSDVKLENNEIKVTATSTPGNALVALKAADGDILWSWHIWVTKYSDQIYTNCEGQPTFMDRNLGATSNAFQDKNTVGLYYQYGRKDPFVIKKDFTPAGNSASYYNSDVELTTYVHRISSVGRMSWTIKNPDKRIYFKSDDYNYTAVSKAWNRGLKDWLMPVGEVEKNWGCTSGVVEDDASCKAASGGYKTIYDPCPKGYKVPDYYYFSGIVANDNSEYADGGWKVDFDGTEDIAYYPLPGTLNISQLNSVAGGVFYYNTRGMYWTTTLAKSDGTYGAAGVFYNSTTLHTKSYGPQRIMNYPTPANIRCMKIAE